MPLAPDTFHAFLDALLAGGGFTTHRVPFAEPDQPTVDNLYARIGDKPPTLLFAGHTDVVPPGHEAAWRHGPFASTVEDGVLFGRGAVLKAAVERRRRPGSASRAGRRPVDREDPA